MSDFDVPIRSAPSLRRITWFATLFALSAVLLATGFARTASAELNFGLQFSTKARNMDPEDWKVLGHSGAEFFRVPFTPQQSFAEYDTEFRLAAENGIRLLPTIWGRQALNESGTGPAGGVPTAAEKPWYTNWIKEAVKRYGINGVFWQTHTEFPAHPAVAWELWNEPNEPGQNGGIYITAQEFGEFISWAGPAVQTAAKEQNFNQPTGVVMGAVLNLGGWEGYLEKAFKTAGASSVTGVAIHPYAIDANSFKPLTRLTKFQDTVNRARNKLNAPGVGGSSETLWVTEYGWHVEWEPTPVSEQCAASTQANPCQADLVKWSIDWMREKASVLDLRAGIWYNYRDSNWEKHWAYRAGLRDEVGNYRRAWFAFQEKMGAPRWPPADTAIQANTGTLWISKRGGGGNTGLAMKAGTSPSIGQYSGTSKAAFQGSNGNLWYYQAGLGAVDTGLGMAPGTSPSISALQGGMIAFQANSGHLWIYQTGGPVKDTGQIMAPKTSPSVSFNPRNGRYPVAFQASTGQLWIYEDGGSVYSSGQNMAPETSPAIAVRNINPGETDYIVAYQSTSAGQMWLFDGTSKPTPYGMAPKTSPGIASVTNDHQVAISFQANTGQMWLYEPGGTIASTGFGMGAGTSPAVAGIGDAPYGNPYQIAFNTTSSLYTYEPGGWVTNTLLGPAPGTSPSIAPG